MFIEVKLKPFQVPNYVIAEPPIVGREDGWNRDCPKFQLNEISEVGLSDLCDEFRKEIFKKAGKADPKLK